MGDFPVMLHIGGRRAVVVGGGAVALRRARALAEAGAEVTVIAPDLAEELERLEGVRIERRAYRAGDLAGAMLVVVATNDPAVNEAAGREAAQAGALVNRADAADEGDISIPAHRRLGPITVAVHTGGASARAAAALRDELLAALDEDWVRLLEAAGPYRRTIRSRVADPGARERTLRRLCDPEAMAVLKREGMGGLRAYCDRLVEAAGNRTP